MEAFGTFLPLILIFAVFYFLLIRPQQRKVKQHKEMLSNLNFSNCFPTKSLVSYCELLFRPTKNTPKKNMMNKDIKNLIMFFCIFK